MPRTSPEKPPKLSSVLACGRPPPPFTPPIYYPRAVPNPKPSLSPTSSIAPTLSPSTDSNSQLSLTPPLSPDAPTTSSDEQSPTSPTLQPQPPSLQQPASQPQSPIPTPGFGSGADAEAIEAEYQKLVALYEKLTTGEFKEGCQPQYGLRKKQGTQKILRDLRQQAEKSRKTEEQEAWEKEIAMRPIGERHADIGTKLLREWVVAGQPRGEVTEAMRQRQRDEVELLASRFGVYHGWAGNRYGLSGQASEMSDPNLEGEESRRGWTGW